MRLPDGAARPVAVPPGPLLGIDPDAVFPVTEIPLTTGTLLVLYTDGLVESPGTDLDDSIAQIADRVAAADDRDLDLFIDTLLGKAATTGQRTDDIALLVLQHASRP
ncbi:SpoIIE family protein phosphatase [Streptomyces sp. NPDC008086]|uniref:SpoIIE family protein phosphatase n=1 Tax=Streptomyces sp. NPDC008086 TaxID=3364807 RepID=UPI0036E06146